MKTCPKCGYVEHPGIPGRPTLLTPELETQIVNVITMGGTMEDAATAAGIHLDTLYTWQREGKNGDPTYAEFFKSLARAKVAAKMADLATIAKAAMRGEWKASAWKLERRYPKEYAPRVLVSIQEELNAGVERLREFFAALPDDRRMGPLEALELALSALAGEGAPSEAPAEEGRGDGGPGGPPVGAPPAEPSPA